MNAKKYLTKKHIIAYAVASFVLLLAGGRALVMNHAGLQDAIVDRALAARLAPAADDFGGDALDVVFCGVASPMGQGGAQSCIAVFAGDRLSSSTPAPARPIWRRSWACRWVGSMRSS